jgi:sulfatase maturation enzyme AslB (radical SAM superfamily)
MPINKKTFCVAPWYGVHLGSDKKLSPCCKYKQSEYEYTRMEEYFHSDPLNNLRQDLMNGVKNPNCSVCWKDEEKGGDSQRLISNRTIAGETGARLFDQIKNPKLSNIKSFDLTLGNLCNLKCVMCKPNYSSQLLAEAVLNPDLKSIYDKEYHQKDFDWPKNDDFVEWCNKYLPQAIHIKFAGGEPFIVPWIHDVVERIPDEQKKKCILHFTTNLTVLNDKMFECFRKFKEVWISVSVEGVEATHEYLRYGHSWSLIAEHMSRIENMAIDNLILKINHVVQSPSYHSIIPMTKFFDEKKLMIYPILLSRPSHFHLSALTETAKQQFLNSTASYAGFNKKFIDFVRVASQEHIAQDTSLTKMCVQHLSRLDKVRKNSHKDIIPAENISL